MAKAVAELKLPKKVDSNLGKALVSLADGAKSVLCLPEKIISIVERSGTALFAPLKAYSEGKASIIEAKSFIEAQNIRKEKSQMKLAQAVIEDLIEKNNNEEKIPEVINDSDTLFAIQNAASEFSDDGFIRFWSKLYTEEACNPDTISKKTIELCKSLDKKVAKILETDIFPYSSDTGWIISNPDYLTNFFIAKDYGLIDDVSDDVSLAPVVFDRNDSPLGRDSFGKFWLWIHPGYNFRMPYRLTMAGQEIKKALKIYPDKNTIQKIGDVLKKESTNWSFSKDYEMLKKTQKEDLFVITDTVYPMFMEYPHPNFRKFDKYYDSIKNNVIKKGNDS